MTKQTTDSTWATDVVEAEGPVLVDFWAPWCSPCTQLEPVLAELAATHADRLTVVKVNVDEQPMLAADHGVASLPTMKVFRAGVAELTLVGARSKAALESELAAYIAP